MPQMLGRVSLPFNFSGMVLGNTEISIPPIFAVNCNAASIKCAPLYLLMPLSIRDSLFGTEKSTKSA